MAAANASCLVMLFDVMLEAVLTCKYYRLSACQAMCKFVPSPAAYLASTAQPPGCFGILKA